MVTNLSMSGAFSSLTSLSSVHPVPGDGAPSKYGGSSQSSLFIGLNISPDGDEPFPVLTDAGTAHSVLSPTTIDGKQSLPWSTNTVQIMGISNEPQKVPVSESIPFCLGPLRNTQPFLLSSSSPAIYQAETPYRSIMPQFLSPKRWK